MPRLFTALELAPETRRLLSMLSGGLTDARWIEPEDYHVTLSFLGDVDERTADGFAEELNDLKHEAFTVAIREIGAFGGAKPRAIVALVEPCRELLDLHASHERAMRRAGLTPESRKYVPHVTLARLHKIKPAAVAGFLGSRQLPPTRFLADRFHLYSSRASTGGGPYIVEATYPLAGRRAQGSSTESQ